MIKDAEVTELFLDNATVTYPAFCQPKQCKRPIRCVACILSNVDRGVK